MDSPEKRSQLVLPASKKASYPTRRHVVCGLGALFTGVAMGSVGMTAGVYSGAIIDAVDKFVSGVNTKAFEILATKGVRVDSDDERITRIMNMHYVAMNEQLGASSLNRALAVGSASAVTCGVLGYMAMCYIESTNNPDTPEQAMRMLNAYVNDDHPAMHMRRIYNLIKGDSIKVGASIGAASGAVVQGIASVHHATIKPDQATIAERARSKTLEVLKKDPELKNIPIDLAGAIIQAHQEALTVTMEKQWPWLKAMATTVATSVSVGAVTAGVMEYKLGPDISKTR